MIFLTDVTPHKNGTPKGPVVMAFNPDSIWSATSRDTGSRVHTASGYFDVTQNISEIDNACGFDYRSRVRNLERE